MVSHVFFKVKTVVTTLQCPFGIHFDLEAQSRHL